MNRFWGIRFEKVLIAKKGRHFLAAFFACSVAECREGSSPSLELKAATRGNVRVPASARNAEGWGALLVSRAKG